MMKMLHFSSYITLLLFLFSAMVHKGMCRMRVELCNPKDQNTLLNFKHAIVDPSSILSSWSSHHDCCQWSGVQCDNTTGRVTMLSLPCSSAETSGGYTFQQDKLNCLTGELNLSLLLQLDFLNHLDFSYHDFKSILLDSINNATSFSNLHYLDLSYNDNLHIDSLQWLSQFSSLKYLVFSGIDLHREIEWLQLMTTLPSLSELYLSDCQLKNINPSLQYANFTSLQVLSLSSNDFGSQFLPNWLFNLTSQITTISLNNNLFKGQVPRTLLNLQSLVSLSLFSNQFSGPIPDWLGQLENLQDLNIGENSFSGPIPPSLGNLSSLSSLRMDSNQLNGSLPESFGNLSNLIVLHVHDNNLSGIVSERNFDKLSNLQSLGIGSPGLIFDFDSLWVPKFRLVFLYLEYIGPKLPEWLYTQTSAALYISSSKISFEPQDKFWDFAAQMEFISLSGNSIDADISNVTLNTTVISLSSNNLKGGLPRLSPNVAVFDISYNSLSGPISSLLCQEMNGTSELVFLDMSYNLLSGGLTDCWKNWESLSHVRLDNNNLTGKIPQSMGSLSNLVVLHLSKNNLSGEISAPLKNCHKLWVLDLEENRFSGNISNCIANNTKVLLLRSNQFSGEIPSQLCLLSSLIILDLADNRISGSIPSCVNNLKALVFNKATNVEMLKFVFETSDISAVRDDTLLLHIKGQELDYQGNLKWMRTIDVSNNNMSGTIPLEIFSLTGLIFLNMSHNQFMGNIPKEIGNLKQLESLDLSSNQLQGEIPGSFSELSFLGSLNLSFNNLSGRIPLGTQLQGFGALSYIGNPQLCGDPLPKNCTHEDHDIKPKGEEEDEKDEFLPSLYIGMGVGFGTAFWVVCGAIFFNKTFRYTYFRFVSHLYDKLYVMVVLKIMKSFS